MASTAQIDWSATGAMLQGIGTLVGAVTVLAAAVIGANTFRSWKRQSLAQRRAAQAERILTATYTARRNLSAVRSPLMTGSETLEAEKVLKEQGVWDETPENNRDRLSKMQAYYNRLNAASKDRELLVECLPMARALFGEELEKALEKLNHQFWTVKVYVDANYHDREGSDRAFRRTIDSTLYQGFPSKDENEIDLTIAAQIKVIEDTCLPALRLEQT